MWKPYPHLLHLDRKLLDVASGRTKRLMVSMPPQHGKSQLTSMYFPAWMIMNYPNTRIVLASYEADFAASWGGKARDVVAEWGPKLAGVRVNPRKMASSSWGVVNGVAEMNSAGSSGPITGKPADLAIIDDPVKSLEDVASESYRKKMIEWYFSSVRSRLQKGARVILVMTRWHEGDLAGKLLKEMKAGKEKWEVVRLPAIAENAESDGSWSRQEGEALCEDLHPLAELEDTRSTVGSYIWATLYQQRPSPMGGGMFKRSWFKYWTQITPTIVEYDGARIEPMALLKFIVVDLAASTRTTADYTVISVWAFTQDNPRKLLLMDMHRERMEGPDIVPQIKKMQARWQCAFVGIESTGFQLSLVQQAKREGLPVREIKSDKDKISRALAATPLMECGRVYFPEKALWLGDLEHELLSFPTGKHDDMVDVLAYACRIGQGVPAAVPTIERAERRGEFEEYQVSDIDWKKDW